jgi:hypothetical protein
MQSKDFPTYQFLRSVIDHLSSVGSAVKAITPPPGPNVPGSPGGTPTPTPTPTPTAVTTGIMDGGFASVDDIDDYPFITAAGGVAAQTTSPSTATEATRSTNQSFTNAVEAAVTFDAVSYDTSTMWAVGSPTRLTATIAGKYLINALIKWTTGLSGTVHSRIYKNGVLAYENSEVGADLSSGNEYHGVTTVVNLVVGDYVELKIEVDLLAGGSINAIGNGIWFQAVLQSPQIGPTGPTGPTGPQGIQGIPGAMAPMEDWESETVYMLSSAGVAGGSGGSVLVEEHTASAAASLNFTTGITSAYDDYLIEIVNLVNGSAATFFFRCSTNGGVSYDSTANYNWSYQYNFATSSGAIGVNADTALNWRNSTTTLAANGSWNGGFRLQSPGSALFKAFVGQLSFHDGTTGLIFLHGGGEYQITTAVNAFQVGVSAGTFNGTVRLYGLSK